MKEERIEYSTIRDDFSVYEIENGQILKAKTSLVDLTNLTDDQGIKKGGAKIQPYSYVITPPDVEKYDIDYTVGQPTEKNQVKELKFKIIKEIVNIYETKKLLILAGLKVEKVFLTNKMDKKKSPLLRYQSLNGVDVIEKLPFKMPKNAEQVSQTSTPKTKKLDP